LQYFLTRLYDFLNACTFSEDVTESHKGFVELLLVTRLLSSIEEKAKGYLNYYLKTLVRIPRAGTTSSTFEIAVNALYDYLDKIAVEPNYHFYTKEICKVDKCLDPLCKYDHEVALSWILTMPTIQIAPPSSDGKPNEDLLAFAYRVENLYQDHLSKNDKRVHEAMDIMASLSVMKGSGPKYSETIVERFQTYYATAPKSAKVFPKVLDIAIALDKQLFAKEQIVPKALTKSMKKAKKRQQRLRNQLNKNVK
jgi:hypothetical protein